MTNSAKQARSLCFRQTSAVSTLALDTNHRSPKMPKPHDLLMDNLILLTFQIFPTLAKPHPGFMESSSTTTPLPATYAPICWQRVCTKILNSTDQEKELKASPS